MNRFLAGAHVIVALVLVLAACDTPFSDDADALGGTASVSSTTVQTHVTLSTPEGMTTLGEEGARGAGDPGNTLDMILNATSSFDANGVGTVVLSSTGSGQSPWDGGPYDATGLSGPTAPSRVSFDGTDITVQADGETISQPLPAEMQQAYQYRLAQRDQDAAYVPTSKNYASMTEQQFIQELSAEGYQVTPRGGSQYEMSRTFSNDGDDAIVKTVLDKTTMEILSSQIYRDGVLQMTQTFGVNAEGKRTVQVTMYPRGVDGGVTMDYSMPILAQQ